MPDDKRHRRLPASSSTRANQTRICTTDKQLYIIGASIMLSLNTRFTTVSPAQYQRINQISLVVLIGSAAIAPAWLNIVTVAGYALMNYLSFKKLCISIIEAVLDVR